VEVDPDATVITRPVVAAGEDGASAADAAAAPATAAAAVPVAAADAAMGAVPAHISAESTAPTWAAAVAPRSHAAIAHLFAEPPQLPPKPVAPAPPPRRWPRRRRLLLVAVTAVGAWLTLGHRRARSGPTSAVLRVAPAAIDPAPAPRLPDGAADTAPSPLRPTDAVASVVAGRATEALQRYRRLAADRPHHPRYRAAVEILIDQLADRCRTERSLSCTASPSPR
jgi:hypothetical protein